MSRNYEIIKFGFLSTIDNPLLPLYLKESSRIGVKNIHVICDSKLISNKDKNIWRERTSNLFDYLNNDDYSIYGLHDSIIPFYFVSNHNGRDAREIYKDLKINCLFNAGTPRKLSSELIKSMSYGVINIHPGLLPAYRGCSAVEWAIYNNDPIGNTAHYMNSGYDAGPIISSQTYLFDRKLDYTSIRVKVYEEGCRLAANVLLKIQQKIINFEMAQIQDESIARYWRPITDDRMVDVHKILRNGLYRFQSF